MDDSLWQRAADANPGVPASKYLDIVGNAMHGYFETMADLVTHFAISMTESQKTYRQIFAGLPDRRQRTVVVGEEDNNWPEPF